MANWRTKILGTITGCICIVLCIQGIDSLKILKLEVPPTVNISQKVLELRCTYDMRGRNLFSLKWYKDESEFYRFTPNIDPRKQMFNTLGISIDMVLSNNNSIYLTNLNYNTSGSYKCEVSTDGPDFHTAMRTKNLTVMALPPVGDPRIFINKHVIAENDNLEANCTTLSNPPAHLTWYINDMKAESWNLNRDERQLHDFGQRYFRSLALKFTVSKGHFITPDEKINLTCQAVIPNYEMPLVNSKLIANLHKSNGYVAAQGSHYNNAFAISAHQSSALAFLLTASLVFIIM